MKLLILTNNPERASFRQRIGIYLDILRAAGVDHRVAKIPQNSWLRRKFFRQAMDFDAVFMHKRRLNLLDAVWARKYCKKIVYDFDDAVMYDPNKPKRDSIAHYNSFSRTAKISDMVIAGNSYLAEHALKFNPNVKVLATGLDTGLYNIKVNKNNDGKVRLVWIGSKSTLPYLAGIKPALEEIGLRFKNVVLRIIADDFFDLRNMEVEKLRWQNETEPADLMTGDIGLSPLPDDRFTRGKCGFKILQYMAAGLPSIVSPVGVNSEYVRQDVTGLFACDTAGYTEKISVLVKDSKLRTSMGQTALADVRRFDMKEIGTQLVYLLKNI